MVWKSLLGAAILQVLALSLAFGPWLGAVLQEPVKEAALFTRARPEAVVLWRMFAPSVSVYREAETPKRDSPEEGELAIVPAHKVPDKGFDILFRRAGVAVVRRIPASPATEPSPTIAPSQAPE